MAAGEDKNSKLQKSYFDVLGLCCSSEVPLVESILKSLDGVKDFSVVVPTKTVIVLHDALLISQLQIVKALNQARLEANVRATGSSSGGNYRKKWPSPYAIGSGILLLLSLLKYVFPPMKWLAVGAVAVGVPPIVLKAVTSLRHLRLDVTVLVLVAVISTMVMKDYPEAATVVFLFTIADWLESRASNKASAVMTSLMSIAPQKAVIAETGEEVDVDEVKLNTILAVKAGEAIPIDGIVVDGQCEVDEKSLTGESFPVAKQKDSTVWAGTINLNGYISVKTTALAEDCVVAKMAKLVEQAQNSKTSTQRFIDRCAQYYTPAIILISAGFAVVPLALRVHNRNYWFHMALVVLVSACPCALVLSTPVATFCALTKAATVGLLIKGGDYLETLAKIKVIAFDKTGTITRGDFVVSDFKSLCVDFSTETLVYLVSSIESKSSHPMAAALVDYGRSLSIEPKPEDVEEYENFPGEGIHGKVDGRDIYIGNKKIALRAGSQTVPISEGGTNGGMTVGYVYCGGTLVGLFNLSDSCRTGAKEAISKLKSLGIRTAMLTGDSQAAAMHAQEQLENALEEVHAELLPEDKARLVGEFKRRGRTAMVGDGINDAPALATSDIGISMGVSGSALSTETGHVILMSNDLRKVPQAIKLARRAHRKVVENVVFSIFTKGSILALAFAGHPLIWAAVLADVGTCVLVILNSMLLLRGSHEHGAKCSKSSAPSHSHGKHHGIGNCCSDKKPEKACQSQKAKCCSDKKAEKACQSAEKTKCCSDKKDEKVCHSQKTKCCTSESQAASQTGCGSNDSKHCDIVEVKSVHNHGCSETHKPTLCTGKDHHHHHETSVHNHGCSETHKPTLCTGKDQHHHHHETESCKKEDNFAEPNHGCCLNDSIADQEKGESMDNHEGCYSVHSDHVDIHRSDVPCQAKSHADCHSVHSDHVYIHRSDVPCQAKSHAGCHSVHSDHVDIHRSDVPCQAKSHAESTCCPSESISCRPVSSCHGGTSKSHSCGIVKARETDSCCKSYRRECCRSNGRFPSGLGGHLTEIVIE